MVNSAVKTFRGQSVHLNLLFGVPDELDESEFFFIINKDICTEAKIITDVVKNGLISTRLIGFKQTGIQSLRALSGLTGTAKVCTQVFW